MIVLHIYFSGVAHENASHFRKIYCTEYGALYLKIKTKMERGVIY